MAPCPVSQVRKQQEGSPCWGLWRALLHPEVRPAGGGPRPVPSSLPSGPLNGGGRRQREPAGRLPISPNQQPVWKRAWAEMKMLSVGPSWVVAEWRLQRFQSLSPKHPAGRGSVPASTWAQRPGRRQLDSDLRLSSACRALCVLVPSEMPPLYPFCGRRKSP